MPRLLTLFAALGVALSACAVERPVLVPVDAPVDRGMTSAPMEGAAEASSGPRGLISPTGVTLAVLGEDADGYRVRTPCGGEAVVAWGTPLHGADIVLDPGHGGEIESGAVGPNGLVERDLNLDVSRAVATALTRRGITVALTRTADYQVPLSVRSELADRLGARALVSIHHNGPSGRPSTRPGTEVFVQQDVEESRRLGGLVWQHVTDALQRFDIEWTTASDAGVLVVRKDTGEASYGMLRFPSTPSVLAELAYLSNPDEAELLATPEYRRVVSLALADAIEAWLRTDDPGAGYVDDARVFTPSAATGGVEGCVDPPLR